MWTLAVHIIVARFLQIGVLIALIGEAANVRACVGNLKVACSEEFLHVDVCIYHLSKAFALYSMGQLALALCNLHKVRLRSPPCMSFTQGTVASAFPIEVVFFFVVSPGFGLAK